MRVSASPIPNEARESSSNSGSGSSLDEANALRDADQAAALRTRLESLARNDLAAFRAALETSLGAKLSDTRIEQLLIDVCIGDVAGPDVQFVDAGTLGGNAYGAYSSEDGGVIYLDRRLSDKQAQLERVFAEEYGHHLDQVIGGVDAAGDEGAIFASVLNEGDTTKVDLARLQVEQDHGFIELCGEQIAGEF